jgi:hypothetical protein
LVHPDAGREGFILEPRRVVGADEDEIRNHPGCFDGVHQPAAALRINLAEALVGEQRAQARAGALASRRDYGGSRMAKV